VLNGLVWVGLAAMLQPASTGHLVLSGVYVAVCAFRSFLPRVDLERIVLVAHPLSSIVLGRSAATVAEMAFAVQAAWVLEGLATATGNRWLIPVAIAVVPGIGIAQVACWAGVLTLDPAWHAVEEALWALFVVVVGVALLVVAPSAPAALWPVLALGVLASAGAAVVMAGHDVPMYVRRSRERRAHGERGLGLREGLVDAWRRQEPSGDWAVWRPEALWMTPYFSGAVWLSLAMAFLQF
jgi:hypothetical protein